MKTENNFRVYALIAILILGAAVRVTGIDFGLPNTVTRPDEVRSVSVAMHMARSGLHPHFFSYPNLFPYVLLFFYSIYFVVGYAVGWFASIEDFKVLYYVAPSSFYLIARMVGAASGILTIYFVYVLGKRLYGTSVGLLAALFLALCPIHVRDSHFAKVDVPMTCLMLLATLFILDVYRRGRLRDYLLSGAISGLAVSTKYTAALLCLNILVAHLLRDSGPDRAGWRKLFQPYLWVAALAMIAAFFIGSPYILIDWRGFWTDFQKVFSQLWGQYSEFSDVNYGRVEYGTGWMYHMIFSLRYGLGLVMEVLAVAGAVWVAWRRRAEELVILSFLIYFLLIGNGRWVLPRYVIPVVPVMLTFAAALFLRLGDLPKVRRLRLPVVCGAVILILAEPVYSIVQFDRLLLREDTRLQAAAWIRAHVPDGSTIALHGGYYAEPQLPESEDMLRERLKGQPGPNRDTYLLEHPVSPCYRLIRLGYFDTAERIRSSWIEMDYDWATLRSRSAGYVVTAESPLEAFARVDDRMKAILNAHATPVAVFDPFASGAFRPIYDPLDAFFVPMSRFSGVERPGPKITIYRLRPEE